MNCRHPVLVAVAAALFVGSAAQAQQVVLGVQHRLPGTSNVNTNLIQAWCDRINKESADKLKCTIDPAMTLGTKSEVFDLPFSTRSAKGSSQAYWTHVQKHSLDEFKGIKPLWLHTNDGSAFHFGAGRNVVRLEDMKGLKIRSAARLNAKMLAALGARPVQQPLPAVPDAISKGVIDGAMVPWEGLPAIRQQEFSRSHFDASVGQMKFADALFAFLMNLGQYDSLPADLTKVIDANGGAAVSACAGGPGFNKVVPAHHRLAAERGNALKTLDVAEYQRWVKATGLADDDWVKAVTAKGANGRALLNDARALIQQVDG